MSNARKIELEKYVKAYKLPDYKMGGPRRAWCNHALKMIHERGDFLDMGTGRGELMVDAALLGFGSFIAGTETVPALIDEQRNIFEGYAHSLPFGDKRFNVSACIDVLEHLLPGDDELAVKELVRVTRSAILISANNRRSNAGPKGEELHINRRPYAEWEVLLTKWSGAKFVYRFEDWPRCTSAMWKLEL